MRDLGAEGEAAWETLRQHVEWAEGVWFGWLFVAAPRDVQELISRLDGAPDVRGPSLVVPLTTVEDTLARVLGVEARDRRAVWIVGQGLEPADWERLHLRLNERRERLRRHLAGPLLLVGRPEWKEAARRGAPDLWSQRVVVLEWEAAGAHSGSPGRAGSALAMTADGIRPRSEVTAPDATLAARGLGRALARGDVEAEAVARTRLSAAHLADGRPGDAREAAVAAVAIAPRGAVRSRALAALAEAEHAIGDVSGAETHYGLALREPSAPGGDEAAEWLTQRGHALQAADRLSEALDSFAAASRAADSPLRRSIALDALGDVALRLGELDRASAAFRESLEIDRALQATNPADPDTSHRVAIALVKVGDVAYDRGDLAAAREAFTESLMLLRRVRSIEGDLPEVLDHLAGVLLRNGDTACARGELERGRDSYDESLGLFRNLRRSRGDQPDILMNLSVALNKLGFLASAGSNLPAARTAFEESVTLCRQARSARGDLPSILRHLLVAVGNLSRIALAEGDTETARSGWMEALAICRQLRAARGVIPETLRDLTIALTHLHNVAPSSALRAEAIEVATELMTRWPNPDHASIMAQARALPE